MLQQFHNFKVGAANQICCAASLPLTHMHLGLRYLFGLQGGTVANPTVVALYIENAHMRS